MAVPNDFTAMIGFEFTSTGDIATARANFRYRHRPGDLLAYDKYSEKVAVWGQSEV